MELSDRVKKRRTELGITQDELARRMGYSSRTSINKIENGRPISQKIIVRLAKALETTPSYLMGWTQEDRHGIGARITELRKKKNKAIYEMANEIGIDPLVLEQYENGTRKIPHDVLERIAYYFNVTVDELITVEFPTSEKTTLVTKDIVIAKQQERWFKEVGFANFTEDELTELINYANFIKSKRNK